MKADQMNVHQSNGTSVEPGTDDPACAEVSAFVDGELGAESMDRVIDALLESDELAQFWAHAHRAGDWMRSDEVIGVGDGDAFIRRFASKLASEPAIIATPARTAQSRSRNFWVKTGLPGVSIAAALVAVAWVATPFGVDDSSRDGKAAQSLAAAPTVAIVPVAKVEQGPTRPVEWQAVDPDRLADYFAAHRDVTPFAYRGAAAARPASFTTGNPPVDASKSP